MKLSFRSLFGNVWDLQIHHLPHVITFLTGYFGDLVLAFYCRRWGCFVPRDQRGEDVCETRDILWPQKRKFPPGYHAFCCGCCLGVLKGSQRKRPISGLLLRLHAAKGSKSARLTGQNVEQLAHDQTTS